MKIFLIFFYSITLLLGIDLFHPQNLKNLRDIDPKNYLVSEKLDGVRAYWNGKNLISKSGKIIQAPQWFIKNFPPFLLDGELYTQRQDFEQILSIVKKQNNLNDWKLLKLHIFEVPNQQGNLQMRLKIIKDYLQQHPNPYLIVIPQYQFTTLQQLKDFFTSIIKSKGEGIVLRKKDTPYYTGRNANSLKYKAFFDSECKIIGYKKSKKLSQNAIGALICKENDLTFYIGSGLTQKLRENPPKIGSIITYKYYQMTKNNKPRHPVFLRIRDDF